MIHQPSSPDHFFPEIVSPLPCLSGLVRHILLYFLANDSLLSLAPLTNATSAFPTL